MNYFLSIDIGTHAIKAALFIENIYTHHSDKKIALLKHNSVKLPHTSSMIHVKNTSQFTWQKQFTETLMLAVKHVFCSINKNITQNDCLYITISGNGPSLVCVNNKDEVVAFVSWQDGIDNNRHIHLKHTESYFLPQLHYLRQYKPQVFSDIVWVLPPAEYVAFLLSGKKNIWVPHDEYSMYIWNKQDIKTYDFSSIFFAPSITSANIVGLANTAFAKKMCGVFKNIYVVAGGLDYLSALIGANIQQNKIFQRSGTSVILNVVLEKKRYVRSTGSNDLQHHFILPHFFKEYINIGFSIPHFERLYQKAHTLSTQKNNNKQYNDLFVALIDTYNKLLNTAGITNYNDVFTISGGHVYNTHFMEMCAKRLGLQVKTFVPAHCELLGNLALGVKASSKTITIKDAIEYVHKNAEVCLY